MAFDEEMEPLVKHGQMVHLENIGREVPVAPLLIISLNKLVVEASGITQGHAYLKHIVNNYDNLAEHTVFSQDIPEHVAFARTQASNTPVLCFMVFQMFLELTTRPSRRRFLMRTRQECWGWRASTRCIVRTAMCLACGCRRCIR